MHVCVNYMHVEAEREKSNTKQGKKMLWAMKIIWNLKEGFGGFLKCGEILNFGTEHKIWKYQAFFKVKVKLITRILLF